MFKQRPPAEMLRVHARACDPTLSLINHHDDDNDDDDLKLFWNCLS